MFDNAEFADRIATRRSPISPQRVGITAIQPTYSPCRRGGLGAAAVSIRKAEIARSARHVRDRRIMSRMSEVAAHRQVISVDRFRVAGNQGSDIFAALGIRRSGPGLDDRDYARFLPNVLTRQAGRQAVPQVRDGRTDDVGSESGRDRIIMTPLFSGRPAASVLALPCAPHRRRTRHGVG